MFTASSDLLPSSKEAISVDSLSIPPCFLVRSYRCRLPKEAAQGSAYRVSPPRPSCANLMEEPPTSSSPVNLLCPDCPLLPHRPLHLARRFILFASCLSPLTVVVASSRGLQIRSDYCIDGPHYGRPVAFSCAHVSSLVVAQWTLLCSSNSKSCLHDKADDNSKV